jgi:hypothetical protein
MRQMPNTSPTRMLALAIVLALQAEVALAVDQLLPGRRLLIRDDGAVQRAAFVLSSPIAPTPGGSDDPTAVGGSVQITNPDTSETATFPLPAGGWTNVGNGAFRFRAASGPVKVALIRNGRIVRLAARASGISLNEASQGRVGVQLVVGGQRYCAVFAGSVRVDVPGRFVARRAPTPSACPGPNPTTTSSTSTTSTSSTTSSTASPLCGNLTIEAAEQCDPPASDCGAGARCNPDCTCPCDPLDPSVCMHPFPNDYFTLPDATSDTGRRLHFSLAGMPRNASNKPIEPSDYNASDGFSPGASIELRVPGVDLAQTGAVPITDIERALDAGQPIVVINASTLQRHLVWAEIDSNASTEAARALIIRPAVNFDEGARYVVALRQMKDANGALIAPGADFLAYRDNTPTGNAAKEARRPHMESLFSTLAAAGIGRSDLYLAWDFTVASPRSTAGRLLHIRDESFAALGSGAPTFLVTQVENEVDGQIFRRVSGQYLVPRWVTTPLPGARFLLGPDGLPTQQPGDQAAGFICTIPRAALASGVATAVPARPSLYGHGLLGSNDEIDAGNVKAMGNEHNFVFCATKWIGMADEDIPNVATILVDLSNFPTLTDRLQQGMLNQLYLARLMIHPNGFASDVAFRDLLGNSVIDPSEVYYDGNSQGGIFGGTVMAVAQDITRGVLGVPAINYSTLLTRSVDFETYSIPLYAAYQNELERPLLFALIQMLWDRSEPNGYAAHITQNPYANTPAHKVLLHEAFGDHQVANIATEVETRTLGASVYQPALAANRHSDVNPYFGIPAIPAFPFDGSALVVWDAGTPTPPTTNTPNNAGSDPHGRPRSQASARLQKSEFLKPNGRVVDVCSGAPCLAP